MFLQRVFASTIPTVQMLTSQKTPANHLKKRDSAALLVIIYRLSADSTFMAYYSFPDPSSGKSHSVSQHLYTPSLPHRG